MEEIQVRLILDVFIYTILRLFLRGVYFVALVNLEFTL